MAGRRRSPYARGRAFEYRVKSLLEGLGLVVFRLARGRPFDLVALSPRGNVYLVECKLRGRPDRRQREAQEAIARRVGARYVVVTSENALDVVRSIRELERGAR